MGRTDRNLIPRQLVEPFPRFEATNGLELQPFGRQVPCREDALPGAGLQTQMGASSKVFFNRTTHGPGTFAFANHCLAMQIPDPNLYHGNANGSNSTVLVL